MAVRMASSRSGRGARRDDQRFRSIPVCAGFDEGKPVKHPHFGRTATGKPVHLHTHDYHPSEHWYDRVNKRVAIFTTKIVGTMWCAYVFAAFDCLALPTALHQGLYGIVQW